MSKLIEIRRAEKRYGQGDDFIYAVKNINLEITRGDYLSIVGPSGAGKSTLLHIIGGIDFPNSGDVLFQGQSILKMKKRKANYWRNKNIGFVFQFYHLIEELNVVENVALPCYLFTGNRKKSFKKAEELLKYLGIEEKYSCFPSQLSGGQQQKVAIARALINKPQVLLCDEPTGNLDHDSQTIVVDLLESFQQYQGTTLIVATHNQELAQRAGSKLHLEAGQIKR
jgi:ABC-type lipoprotein export system ATPase subunit